MTRTLDIRRWSALLCLAGLVQISACVATLAGTADEAAQPTEAPAEVVEEASAAADETDLIEAFSAAPVELAPAYPLLNNVAARDKTSLNGKWNIVVDEHEIGERAFLGGPYYSRPTRETGMELVEFSFDDRRALNVPGDWNSQDDRLFRYRGVVWYERSLEMTKAEGKRYFLHFDGVNYDARVYVNGDPLGQHKGGYVAFNFDATDLLQDGENYITVRVDAKRDDSTIPTMTSSDFFKYGGITRDVSLVSTPETFIRQYQLYLADHAIGEVRAWVQLDGASAGQEVTIEIPEAGITQTLTTDADGRAEISFNADLKLWSPESPNLYTVKLSGAGDEISDRIGFRTIERDGLNIVLNGEPVFLRGISMHDESPLKPGVAFDESDARTQLGLIKELNGNFVRLSHYPHNEYAVRIADELGLMVWSEIPIVSLIDWDNPETKQVAITQLRDNIHRDLNRASIVMWSIGNETFPQSEERFAFLAALGETARAEDESGRLIAAALVGDVTREFEEVGKRLAAQMIMDPDIDPAVKPMLQGMLDHSGTTVEEALNNEIQIMLEDRLGEIVDVVGYNEYFGWYYSSFLGGPLPVDEGTVREHMFKLMDDIRFRNVFNKPIIISEFGAGAKYGNRSAEGKLWSEEYQAKVYRAQTSMLENSEFVQGMSPWILKDFKSAMRNLNGVQDIYNRKGLISETGQKKQAFYVLRDHYAAKAAADEQGD